MTVFWKNNLLIGVCTFFVLCAAIPIASGDTVPKRGAGATPFVWNQNEMWSALETRFRHVRSAGCPGVAVEIDRRLQEGNRQLMAITGSEFGPADRIFDAVEANLFALGPLLAACPARIAEYAQLIGSARTALKRLSVSWDADEGRVYDRLYRILYGGRIALEEVMLQASGNSLPAITYGIEEPSQTPSSVFAGFRLHSGDILVSRGAAPTSALIARGNDHPGNFSHIALLYIDEATGMPSIIEAHIERGVVISTPEEYMKDTKLRIMVLRVRDDHPLLKQEPMLPHRAAKKAYEEARKKHIPYDFAMDIKDSSAQFCSEVAYQAYAGFGINLWSITTTMSSPGVVAWLGDFGVRNFLTQAPADIEYDPQLTVIAEGRDKEALWQAHVDDAVIDAMLEGANRGDDLICPVYLLVPTGLAKAYSVVLNSFGNVGPVPEGMSIPAAVKATQLERKHRRLKKEVLVSAIVFEKEKGYKPPYWELVDIARKANERDQVFGE